MSDWEQFEQHLQEALTHLYDPGFQPSQCLYGPLGCDPREGVAAVQSVVLHSIESLQPPPDTPPGARTSQIYDVLHARFVIKLTQEAAAEHLHMSVSTVKRAQREAAHAIARLLWERGLEEVASPGSPMAGGGRPASPAAPDLQAADWHAQARRELASLEASAPGAVSDVGDVVGDVLDLERALAPKQGPRVTVGFIQPGLVATVHPALLRQMVIAALGKLSEHPAIHEVRIFGGLEDGNVRITLTGPLPPGGEPSASNLAMDDVLVPEGGSVWSGLDGDRLVVRIELSSVGRTTVLVVDDNEDMARFYRRATAGTRYHIVHAARGQDVRGAIDTAAPDAIVLDVMLPDVDGWRLLMHLREDPATQAIPVIVSSVVREEKLARSLGAAAYLSKPVRPRQFIQVLDEVLSAGSARGDRVDGLAD